jgi:hypothetical protein
MLASNAVRMISGSVYPPNTKNLPPTTALCASKRASGAGAAALQARAATGPGSEDVSEQAINPKAIKSRARWCFINGVTSS